MLLEKMISILALSAVLMDGSMDAAMPDKNIDGKVFLVNRQHALNQRYVPSDLRDVLVHGISQDLRDEAAAALEALFQEAEAAGVPLSSVWSERNAVGENDLHLSAFRRFNGWQHGCSHAG